MTGFARVDGAHGAYRWVWEVKSVNGRSLDLRFRLPAGVEHLEPALREAAARRFQRGHLQVLLSLQREAGAARVRVNRAALDALIAELQGVAAAHGLAPPTVEPLLAVKGIVESAEEEEGEEQRAVREAALGASFEEALSRLQAMRESEGAALARLVTEQLGRIGEEIAHAAEDAARRPEAGRERLREQVARLLEAGVGIAEERLAQEAALIAARGDVQEEIDRLRTHLEAAGALLAGEGAAAIGRRLDFLAQEFNREANTLCSKASDRELTRRGLELKALIEQFREQVQNLE